MLFCRWSDPVWLLYQLPLPRWGRCVDRGQGQSLSHPLLLLEMTVMLAQVFKLSVCELC
jgi:hypothetical protein